MTALSFSSRQRLGALPVSTVLLMVLTLVKRTLAVATQSPTVPPRIFADDLPFHLSQTTFFGVIYSICALMISAILIYQCCKGRAARRFREAGKANEIITYTSHGGRRGQRKISRRSAMLQKGVLKSEVIANKTATESKTESSIIDQAAHYEEIRDIIKMREVNL